MSNQTNITNKMPSSSTDSEDVKRGWLERGTKTSDEKLVWPKCFITLERSTRCLKQAENDDTKVPSSSSSSPDTAVLMKKITREAEKNESLKAGNPDLFSFTIEGVNVEDSDDKNIENLLFRCSDENSFNEWYVEIRASIASHGLMDPMHYGLPDRDPRCDLPLVSVPVEHLFRFSLLDKAVIYYFAPVQLCDLPSQRTGGDTSTLSVKELMLVLSDKHYYLFDLAGNIIRCFPVTSLEAIHVGEKCIALKLEHPYDVLLRAESPLATIVEIIRRKFFVATGADVDVHVESSENTPIQLARALNLRPYDGYRQDISSPTPKQKLKHALDIYERQYGKPFVYENSAENTNAEKTDQEEDGAALTPQRCAFTDRIRTFYKKYDPSKVDNAENLAEKYEGQEENLFGALVAKYGPEPEGETSD